jgi:hypothetical protein
MSDYEFTMSLRIRHPDIDPTEISNSLGLQPQHTWCAGEARRDSAGSALSGTYRETFWVCELMSSPELSTDQVGVESELQRVLGTLRRSFDFLQTLHGSGGATEIYISIFAREEFRLELGGELAALLGRLGITTAIEVKPHAGSAPPSPAP